LVTPKCIYNYDQLRKIAPPSPINAYLPTCEYVFVAGFLSGAGLLHPMDVGMEGFFEWRPESPEDDNGGTVIRPNALSSHSKGRWHRVFDGALSVKWFGARGDGSTDDTVAINAAIDAAGASKIQTIWIPPGRYRLTHAIRPEFDNLTVSGSARSILIADPPDGEQFPEAILVNRNFPNPPDPVRGVAIRQLIIEVKNGAGGNVSAGVVQLNNCQDCFVSDVHLKYIGPEPKPKSMDGIVTSQGTTGLIQSCVVDGIPKAGIYVAQGSHDVRIDTCEVKNTSGPIGSMGISVTGSDRITISNCLSHDNAAAGLLIAVNGPIGSNPPVPARNIQVLGGLYSDNRAEGILIASAYDGVRPENIQLHGVMVLNNDGRGINVEAGSNILIAGASVIDNGFQGIWLVNQPIGPTTSRTARVQISSPLICNNGRLANVDVPGIGVSAAEEIIIIGGKFSKTVMTRRQNYGVGVHKSPSNQVCKHLRILDVDASVGQIKSVAALDLSGVEDETAAAETGYYRVQGLGNPESSLSAPIGSEYVDLSTGLAYRKAAGSGSTGWVLL
jgi:hypothetical protein